MTRAIVLSIVLSATFAPRAYATDEKALAAQMFSSGKDRFKRKDYEGARAALARAYELDPSPRYLWDLALAEVLSEHPVDALRHLRRYLSLPDATDEHRRKARQAIAELGAKAAHAVIDVPDGATVRADGQEVALPVDHTLDFAPGRHAIEIQAGTHAASATIDAVAGETVRLEPHFEEPVAPAEPAAVPPPAPAPPAPGLASSPSNPSPVTAGPDAPPPQASTSAARWIVSGGLVAAGVAGLSAGAVFFANAGHESTTITNLSGQTGNCANVVTPNCTKLGNALDARAGDQNTGAALVLTGAGLVAAGVVTWLVWPAGKTAAAGYLAPIVTAHGAGALWERSF